MGFPYKKAFTWRKERKEREIKREPSHYCYSNWDHWWKYKVFSKLLDKKKEKRKDRERKKKEEFKVMSKMGGRMLMGKKRGKK